MQRIANTQELTAELQRLLAYSQIDVVEQTLRTAGFSFQDPQVEKVQVTVEAYLERFRALLDEFAEQEKLALQILSASNEELNSLDSKQISTWSSNFWQTRNWHFGLTKVVPLLVLELIKFQPANIQDLFKASKFYAKPFKWSPDGTWETLAKKYLTVLKDLRGQLKACQKAASGIGTQEAKPTVVGKFELFSTVGEEALAKAETVLKQATSAMTRIGLGKYCYGKVVVVPTSKLTSRSSAFYVKNTDEIFLSPDVRGGEDIMALCHEVAHRVHETLHLKTHAAILYADTRNQDAWVTAYAKTSPEENFCEMVAFAALGRLSAESKVLLEKNVPIKLACASAIAARVAMRYAHESLGSISLP
jgi:hypothetical protein